MFELKKPKRPRAEAQSICFVCNEQKATIRNKITGGFLEGGKGYCQECYERAIRRSSRIILNPRRRSLTKTEETDHIVLFL